MRQHALWWASKGAAVLPLHTATEGVCSCGDQECTNAAKHPVHWLVPNGLNNASTDPAVIDEWWSGRQWNIGVRTGDAFDVIDVDSLDGAETLNRLIDEHGTPENLGTARSGRDGYGMHLYVAPGGLKALAGGRTSPPGIDWKGRGGYVVAPPSVHASGRAYTWSGDHHFDSGEVAGVTPTDVFHKALEVVRPTNPVPARLTIPDPRAGDAYGNAVLGRAVELVRTAGPGSRWQTLATEAIPTVARAVDGGCLDPVSAVRELEDAARYAGLGEAEIRRVGPLTDELLRAGIRNPIRPTGAPSRAPLTPLPRTEIVDEWEPVTWTAGGLPDLPDAGPLVAEYVRALSAEYQVPPDLPGVMLLALSAAIVDAETTITGHWVEPTNLYTAVVMGAGEMKSPVLSRLTGPLRAVEKTEQDAVREEMGRRMFARELAEQVMDRAKKAAFKASNEYEKLEAIHAAETAIDAYNSLPVPVLPLRLAGDMTPEALLAMLEEQDGRLAHLSAEGTLLGTIVGGRYSGGDPSIGGLLMAHDGREPVKVHRRHAEDIIIENPRLTLGLAIQPHVLAQIGSNPAARETGLTARFLYAVPVSLVGGRNMDLATRNARNARNLTEEDVTAGLMG